MVWSSGHRLTVGSVQKQVRQGSQNRVVVRSRLKGDKVTWFKLHCDIIAKWPRSISNVNICIERHRSIQQPKKKSPMRDRRCKGSKESVAAGTKPENLPWPCRWT